MNGNTFISTGIGSLSSVKVHWFLFIHLHPHIADKYQLICSKGILCFGLIVVVKECVSLLMHLPLLLLALCVFPNNTLVLLLYSLLTTNNV